MGRQTLGHGVLSSLAFLLLAAAGCGGSASSPGGEQDEQTPGEPSGEGPVTAPPGTSPPGAPSAETPFTPSEGGASAPVEPPGSAERTQCGDVSEIRIVSTQAQVDALAGCNEFMGALVLEPPAGETLDLRPLASLRRVGQDLAIGCNSFTLTNEGDCRQTGAASLTLDGLENLEEVASLTLGGLSVSSLSQLGNLTMVAAFLSIDRCNELESLEGLEGAQIGTLHLRSSLRLTSLAGLTATKLISGIQIAGMPQLTDLTALAPLTSLGYLHLGDMPLQNLDVLSNLRELRIAYLIDLPLLSDISALRQVREIDELRLAGTALENLDALSLTGVGSLSLTGNAQLTNVDALANVTRLNDIRVSNNPLLERLPAFAGVTVLESLDVSGNDSLLEGPSFPNVIDMASGNLSILVNQNLQRIDGFSSLEDGGWIRIAGNPSLESVAFPRLQSAVNLEITCNLGLPDASLAALSQVPTTVGSQVIGNQGAEATCQ